MIQDYKRIVGMSNKEIMWVIASKWIDEIAMAVVNDADELMENPFTAEVVKQAAEHELKYREIRREVMVGKREPDDVWYNFEGRDRDAFETVLYDCLFQKYGRNSKV